MSTWRRRLSLACIVMFPIVVLRNGEKLKMASSSSSLEFPSSTRQLFFSRSTLNLLFSYRLKITIEISGLNKQDQGSGKIRCHIVCFHQSGACALFVCNLLSDWLNFNGQAHQFHLWIMFRIHFLVPHLSVEAPLLLLVWSSPCFPCDQQQSDCTVCSLHPQTRESREQFAFLHWTGSSWVTTQQRHLTSTDEVSGSGYCHLRDHGMCRVESERNGNCGVVISASAEV